MRYFEHKDRERELERFRKILCSGEFCVGGYRKGCVDALIFLRSYNKRIDNLILIRPPIDDELLEGLRFTANKGIRIEIFTTEVEIPPELRENLAKVSTLYIFKNFRNIR